ncbi:MAG: hypothetical protein KIS67_03785 [Verrucomicrobiae bacterium]|nr:hypothetical protein [Verrucomicrobiae bacterium]
MKTILLLLLLLAVTCHAEDTTGITNKVSEIDRDKDGKVDVRMEMFYRGKTRVMMTMSKRSTSGEMAIVSRSYLAGGELRMTESDEDGDGFLETVYFHASDSDEIEVFKRHADGSVRPVSTSVLDVHRRIHALQTDVGQVMGDYMEGKIDTDGVVDGAQRVREKAERLRQELQKLEKHENQ